MTGSRVPAAAKEGAPTLHIIAGPNGAGKSTLYRNELQDRYPSVEFVNADELAQRHYGHPAQTLEESRGGQRLADERRHALIVARKSLITESTFSHPSKLDLVREALAAGYRVFVYHVNVQNADLSVDRVAFRVTRGGHPVPEEKIRGRYERSQQLIREAVGLADRAYVFDNSALAMPHRLMMEFRHGQLMRTWGETAAWAQTLYDHELSAYAGHAPSPRPRHEGE